jgi:hypothetical protein
MPAPSVALLTFNRNDPKRTLGLVRRLAGAVVEAVVVDSSDPGPWESLERELSSPGQRAVRAIPTGYADLLQPYGVDAVRAEWVFYCDPDEEPSPDLLRRLSNPEGADAYIVPRWERTLGAFTPHLRLYRRSAFLTPDPAYAFPGIRGIVRKLPRAECLVHHQEYRPAVDGEYSARYVDLESYERPVDSLWMRRALAFGGSSPSTEGGGRRSPASSRPISGAAAATGALATAARELVRTGSPAAATFQWKYHRARIRFMGSLSPEERSRRAAITRATRAGGGLIRYLGFDRPEYVRALSESFTWDREGLEVLHRLIDYRFERGEPMPRWQPPTPASSTPVSNPSRTSPNHPGERP